MQHVVEFNLLKFCLNFCNDILDGYKSVLFFHIILISLLDLGTRVMLALYNELGNHPASSNSLGLAQKK